MKHPKIGFTDKEATPLKGMALLGQIPRSFDFDRVKSSLQSQTWAQTLWMKAGEGTGMAEAWHQNPEMEKPPRMALIR